MSISYSSLFSERWYAPAPSQRPAGACRGTIRPWYCSARAQPSSPRLEQRSGEVVGHGSPDPLPRVLGRAAAGPVARVPAGALEHPAGTTLPEWMLMMTLA